MGDIFIGPGAIESAAAQAYSEAYRRGAPICNLLADDYPLVERQQAMEGTMRANPDFLNGDPMPDADVLRAEISALGRKFEEEVGALNDKVAARDARIAELEEALDGLLENAGGFQSVLTAIEVLEKKPC
jgi:hypothetical protein